MFYGYITLWELLAGILAYLVNLFNGMVIPQYGIYATILSTRYKALNTYLKSALYKENVRNNGKLTFVISE